MNFKASGDSFTEDFFQSVYRQQIAMLEKLQLRKNKLDKKVKCIHAWREVSSTYMAIKDLDNIRVLVDQLDIETEALLQNAEITIEQEGVKIGIDEMKKKLGVFMKIVEVLGATSWY
ncbi:hypothetical protein V6N12_070703 [Hibiscus sabdariffa]|uniref:Uncharacterized protein n=1 Tax=Hibiscus sabdariffa TaxID=183260 RepID=A0ABR2FHM3_9ROSI